MGWFVSVVVVCWLQAGALVSDNITEPLSLAVDGCVPDDNNFTQIASVSVDSIMESEDTWQKLYQMLTEIDLNPLAGAFGHAGGFAVICGYFVREILGIEHDFGAYRFNAEKNVKQNDSDFLPVWVKLNKWEGTDEGSGNSRPLTNRLKFLRQQNSQNLFKDLISNSIDTTTVECYPNILYLRSAFEKEREHDVQDEFDGTAELATLIQQVANAFGDYLGYPCLGNILYTIFEDSDNDVHYWNEESITAMGWTGKVLNTISTTPQLKYGLRNIYLCVVNNYHVRNGLEKLLLPLMPAPVLNISPRVKEVCHIHRVWEKHDRPETVIDLLLVKLRLRKTRLEQCFLLPNITANLNVLTPDALLRIRMALVTIRYYDEKEIKETFSVHVVMQHLSILQVGFLQSISESDLVQFRNTNPKSPLVKQWQYDCLRALIGIFSKPLKKRYKRWWFWGNDSPTEPTKAPERGWWFWGNDSPVKPTKVPKKHYSLSSPNYEHKNLETLETFRTEENVSETYNGSGDSQQFEYNQSVHPAYVQPKYADSIYTDIQQDDSAEPDASGYGHQNPSGTTAYFSQSGNPEKTTPKYLKQTINPLLTDQGEITESVANANLDSATMGYNSVAEGVPDNDSSDTTNYYVYEVTTVNFGKSNKLKNRSYASDTDSFTVHPHLQTTTFESSTSEQITSCNSTEVSPSTSGSNLKFPVFIKCSSEINLSGSSESSPDSSIGITKSKTTILSTLPPTVASRTMGTKLRRQAMIHTKPTPETISVTDKNYQRSTAPLISNHNQAYLLMLFENITEHDLVVAIIDVVTGTRTRKSGVYIIEMILHVLYGYDSVSGNYVTQHYLNKVKDMEEESDDL